MTAERDEAPAGRRRGLQGNKTTDDTPSIGAGGRLDKFDDATATGTRAEVEQHDKLVVNLKARCALAGYSLFIIQATDGGSSFLVQRWDRSRELRDVAEVEAFLSQAGAQ